MIWFMRAADDANVTVSGGSMVLNGEETFVISDDTQINVVLVPDEDAGFCDG